MSAQQGIGDQLLEWVSFSGVATLGTEQVTKMTFKKRLLFRYLKVSGSEYAKVQVHSNFHSMI